MSNSTQRTARKPFIVILRPHGMSTIETARLWLVVQKIRWKKRKTLESSRHQASGGKRDSNEHTYRSQQDVRERDERRATSKPGGRGREHAYESRRRTKRAHAKLRAKRTGTHNFILDRKWRERTNHARPSQFGAGERLCCKSGQEGRNLTGDGGSVPKQKSSGSRGCFDPERQGRWYQ